MTSSSDITLFVPGLLGPQPAYTRLSATDKPNLQRLEAWLSRAEQSQTNVSDPLCGLFALFNLNNRGDVAPPIAAVTAAFDGLDAGHGVWLRADPVYLQPDRHQAVLVASEALALQADECAALLETLNTHFAAGGWQIQAPHPQRWYIQLQEADSIRTTPLPQVMGQGVNQHLPQGKQRQQWHGWLNELQMLLHQHPVNQQRVRAGKLPVNSVWLWGEGRIPPVVTTKFDQVYGDDILLEALAELTGASYAALSTFDPHGTKGRCLLVSNECYASLQDKDVFRWLAWLEVIQNQYLLPLQANLKQQPNSSITLLPANGRQYRMTQRRLPRWWHRRKPLEAFLSR
jgi:hypothetical protein